MMIVMIFGYSIYLIEYPEWVDNPADVRVQAHIRIGCLHGFDKLNKLTLSSNLTTTKQNLMKVKDLKDYSQLRGLKVRTKKGVIGYVFGDIDCGLLLSEKPIDQLPGKEQERDELRLYPQIFMKKEDIGEWDIIEDINIRCNCADLTSHKYILND